MPNIESAIKRVRTSENANVKNSSQTSACLLYTSDAADEEDRGELGGRRNIKKKNKIRL